MILTTQTSQKNSNHSLGFRGMRTWPCVDATQGVTLVGVWLSETRCCYASLEIRWKPCLSKISPSFFLIPAVSASSPVQSDSFSLVILSLHIVSSRCPVWLFHTSATGEPFSCVRRFYSHSNVFYASHSFGYSVWLVFLCVTSYPWCDMTPLG